MIEEVAKVVEVDGQIATVTSRAKSACSGCEQVESCGSGQVAKAFSHKDLTLKLETNLSIKSGDTVVIGISEQCILESAWQVYLWPLIGLIVSAALGQWLVERALFSHELYGVVLGLAGGYLGYRLARYKQTSGRNADVLAPKILRILHAS